MEPEFFTAANVVRCLVDYEGTRRWYMMEHVSRDNDLPAVEYVDGTRCWYWMGVQHRFNDLPAVERADGSKEWWYYGQWVKTIGTDGRVRQHPRFDKRRSAYFTEQERRYRKILKASFSHRVQKATEVREGIADLTELFSTESQPFFVNCFVSGNPKSVYWEELLFDKSGVQTLIDWFAGRGYQNFARWESDSLFAFDHDHDEFRASALVNVTINGSAAALWKLIPGASGGLAVEFAETKGA